MGNFCIYIYTNIYICMYLKHIVQNYINILIIGQDDPLVRKIPICRTKMEYEEHTYVSLPCTVFGIFELISINLQTPREKILLEG